MQSTRDIQQEFKFNMQYGFFTLGGKRFEETAHDLGKGTNGEVKAFVSSDCKKEYAVKTLPTGESYYASLVSGRDKFKRTYPSLFFEVAIERREWGISGIYSVMDVIPGFTCETIFSEKRASKAALLDLLIGITEELERIHGLGVIHGDINPKNILVSYVKNAQQSVDRVVRFIDFEWSYLLQECARTTTWMCSYFAPERQNQSVDPSLSAHPNQDVYSLAYMIVQLSHRYGVNWSSQLKDLLLRGTSFEPAERPSLAELLKGLNAEIVLSQDFSMTAPETNSSYFSNSP